MLYLFTQYNLLCTYMYVAFEDTEHSRHSRGIWEGKTTTKPPNVKQFEATRTIKQTLPAGSAYVLYRLSDNRYIHCNTVMHATSSYKSIHVW